jgi:hypothetical protein
MGILTSSKADPREWTPVYSTNVSGCTSWSGKHISEMTALDLVALFDFCCNEASRIGWNDAASSRIDVDASNPFHFELLGGYPHREWAIHYMQGVSEQTTAASGGGGVAYE